MKINSIIKKIEEEKYSFLTGFISLYAIILCRNIFESVFESSQVLGFSPIISHSFYMIFIHFPLFYISILLWILLVFILLTKENITKVSKFLLIGFTTIIIAPFIDFIVSKGSGYKLTYLSGFRQISEIHRFFDFTKDLIQASWGQRIEILLVLIGAFLYVLIKTKNYFKAIFASIIIYLIIFLHGVLPNTIAKIPSYLGFNKLNFITILTNGILPIDSQNYAVIFSISIILSGFFILRKSRKELNDKIFDFRPSIFIIIPLCLGILYGIYLIFPYYPFVLQSPITYLIFLLAIFLFIFVNEATTLTLNSLDFKILITVSILFSIALGPLFLFLISIFFLIKKLLKNRWILIIPCFIAGFSLIFQEYTFKVIIPLNKMSLVTKGMKLSGWSYFLNTDYKKALDKYIKLYIINKGNEIQLRLGQCYLNIGQLGKGIEILEKIKEPGYETILTLGQVYTQRGEYKNAIKIYKNAIEENIEPAEFYIKIANVAARMGDEKELNISTENSLLYGSPKYIIYQIKGDFYLGKGDLKKALEMYKKALYFNSRSVSALAGIGIIYYNQGDFLKAEEQFSKALKFEPDNYAIYNNLGVLYLVTGRYEKAEYLFKKSININQNQTEAYYNLGLIYEQKRRIDDALLMFENALKVNPTYDPARRKIEDLRE